MFTSRIDRLGFFLGNVYLIVPTVAVIMLYAIVNFLLGGSDTEAFSPVRSGVNILLFLFGAASIILYWPVMISLSVRRWHDMNQSGWLTILSFLPVAGTVIFFVQLFAKGTIGQNDHGAEKPVRSFFEVLFGKTK